MKPGSLGSTSTADINEAGQRRTSASLSGRRTSPQQQPERARIELLKRRPQGEVVGGKVSTAANSRTARRASSADGAICIARTRLS